MTTVIQDIFGQIKPYQPLLSDCGEYEVKIVNNKEALSLAALSHRLDKHVTRQRHTLQIGTKNLPPIESGYHPIYLDIDMPTRRFSMTTREEANMILIVDVRGMDNQELRENIAETILNYKSIVNHDFYDLVLSKGGHEVNRIEHLFIREAIELVEAGISVEMFDQASEAA